MANFTNNADADFQIGCTSGVTTIGPDVGVLALKSSSAERARIDSSGRLLVGTSTARGVGSPSTWKMQIEGLGTDTGYPGLGLTNNTNDNECAYIVLAKTRGTSIGSSTIVQNNDNLGVIAFAGADGTDIETRGAEIRCAVDGTPGANDLPTRLVFSTCADGASSPTERLRVTNNGVVAVNGSGLTFANSRYFQVVDGNSSRSVGYVASDGSGNEWHFGRSAVDGYFYVVRQTGTGMYMNTNSWVATSDQRAKQNITDIESTIDVVKALKPSRFNWKTDGTADVGFIAQQVQPLIPEAVVDSGDPDAMLGITQDKLLPFVVKALQEAVAKIETLEAKVAALESV